MSLINLSHGDGCWPDLMADESKVIDMTSTTLEMAYNEDGTDDHKPSVALKFTLPDGHIVFYQCDMSTWLDVQADLMKKFRN